MKQKRSKKNRVTLIIILVLIAAIVGFCTTIFVVSSKNKEKVRKSLNLGNKYLCDFDYKNAIASYKIAIQVDPKCVDAYLGLADAYAGQGKFDKALRTLKDAKEHVKDSVIDEKIKEIEELKEKEKDIPKDALRWNGHKYCVFDINLETYEEAEKYCKERNGYLATISSEAENKAVFKYITKIGYENVYFGLTDRDEEGVWTYTNGEPVGYINWNEGEPNNESSRENYAMFYYKYTEGTWNDGDFGHITVNSGKAFLCEWD